MKLQLKTHSILQYPKKSVLVHSKLPFNKSTTVKPGVYFRYVDNSFVIFDSELDCNHFQEKLNLLHPALKFTIEKEQKKLLAFSKCFGRERGHWISYQHLQETNFYWAIHPLEFL